MTGMPKGNMPGNPVETAVFRRIWLTADIDLIDTTAAEIDNGRWTKALILSCCRGVPYDKIDPSILPTSHRHEFYKARRQFFFLLHSKKYGGGQR